MVLALWSPKGGSGCTVVASALAVAYAHDHEQPALLIDGCGDIPAALGMLESPVRGVSDWLALGNHNPPHTLLPLTIATTAGVRVLPWGSGVETTDVGMGDRLIREVAGQPGAVVLDLGSAHQRWQAEVIAAAPVVTMVIRPCYLALRRARMSRHLDITTGAIVVEEAGRKISAAEIEDILGVPVWSTVPVRPTIASVVDAGVLASRLPEALLHGARRVWASAPAEVIAHVA